MAEVVAGPGSPARQPLLRAMNEQLLLEHIRRAGQLSRADLARVSRLSKPTVSGALAKLERAGLVRTSGARTGVPGPAAILYEVRPEAGFVLGLDAGSRFLRGGIVDFTGRLRARTVLKARAANAHGRIAELVELAGNLFAEAGITAADVTQTVLGCPGVYDRTRDALILAGALPGWDKPFVLTELRRAFGGSLMVENDVDAAALAERAHGHGRGVDSFALVWIGTGIGMGLVLGGRLHRGAHGAAGEIGYLPFDSAESTDARDARRRGSLEAAASAAGIVRAARRKGMRGPVSARHVFTSATRGDERAGHVIENEALLIAKAVSAVVAVADPELVVLGGGIGQAPGFLDAVAARLPRSHRSCPSYGSARSGRTRWWTAASPPDSTGPGKSSWRASPPRTRSRSRRWTEGAVRYRTPGPRRSGRHRRRCWSASRCSGGRTGR